MISPSCRDPRHERTLVMRGGSIVDTMTRTEATQEGSWPERGGIVA